MSDIPIGSPPAPPGRHAAPSGWYPDPVDPAQERYWDGWQWSRNTRVVERPPTPAGYGGWPPGGAGGAPPAPPQPYAPVGYRPRGLVLTADGVPVAGWWWRALAVVVDYLIVSVVAAAAAFPVYQRLLAELTDWFSAAMTAVQAGSPPPPQPSVTTLLTASDQLWVLAAGFVVRMVYDVGFLRWKAATPGKLVTGLRVVPVDQGRHAARLPWAVVIIRSLVWVVPTLSGYLYLVRLLDVLFPLWHPKRQALHDLAAKTQVVKIS